MPKCDFNKGQNLVIPWDIIWGIYTMGHQCDITDEFEKLPISPEEKQSDDAHSIFLLFKPKVLNAINKIREIVYLFIIALFKVGVQT